MPNTLATANHFHPIHSVHTHITQSHFPPSYTSAEVFERYYKKCSNTYIHIFLYTHPCTHTHTQSAYTVHVNCDLNFSHVHQLWWNFASVLSTFLAKAFLKQCSTWPSSSLSAARLFSSAEQNVLASLKHFFSRIGFRRISTKGYNHNSLRNPCNTLC